MTMRLIARREPGAPHVFLPACVASARGVSTTQQVRAAHTCTILSRRAAKLSGSSRSDASDIPDVGRLADIPPLAPALRARVPAACWHAAGTKYTANVRQVATNWTPISIPTLPGLQQR